jgi:hypothetical protein
LRRSEREAPPAGEFACRDRLEHRSRPVPFGAADEAAVAAGPERRFGGAEPAPTPSG